MSDDCGSNPTTRSNRRARIPRPTSLTVYSTLTESVLATVSDWSTAEHQKHRAYQL